MQPTVDQLTSALGLTFIEVDYPVNMAFGDAPKASTRKGLVLNSTEAVKHVQNKPKVLRQLQSDGIEVLPFDALEAMYNEQSRTFSRGNMLEFAQEHELMVKHASGSCNLNPNNGGDLMRMLRDIQDPSRASVLRMPNEYTMITATGAPKAAGKIIKFDDVDFDFGNGILSLQGEVDTFAIDPNGAQELIEKRTLEILDELGLDYGTVEFAMNSEGLFVADVHSRFNPTTLDATNNLIKYMLKKRGR